MRWVLISLNENIYTFIADIGEYCLVKVAIYHHGKDGYIQANVTKVLKNTLSREILSKLGCKI